MAEEAYFERTRMFPIMHVVGIRRSLLEKHPWLAVNTYAAYQKAKEICYRQLETIGHLFTSLPWPVEELARARALMGDDFWSSREQGNIQHHQYGRKPILNNSPTVSPVTLALTS